MMSKQHQTNHAHARDKLMTRKYTTSAVIRRRALAGGKENERKEKLCDVLLPDEVFLGPASRWEGGGVLPAPRGICQSTCPVLDLKTAFDSPVMSLPNIMQNLI